MGPPSSGATTVSQLLKLIEPFELKESNQNHNADTWAIISEAARLAFADRGAYIADPAFHEVPTQIFEQFYLKQRSSLINPKQIIPKVTPGQFDTNIPTDKSLDLPSTTHFVIVDKDRNIVSMTSTIENSFGSRLMVNGFMLNNELTDFSFSSTKNGKAIANSVAPGKRPRSSMAPTIVFKDNKPYLAIGSPGGSRIINYVANAIIRKIDFKMSLFEAINAPHIINRFGTLELEKDRFKPSELERLKSIGYPTKIKDLNSGIHGVLFKGDELVGAADLRREGSVAGH